MFVKAGFEPWLDMSLCHNVVYNYKMIFTAWKNGNPTGVLNLIQASATLYG